MRALGDLARTKVTVETGPVRRAGDGGELTATVHNGGGTVAAMVRLSVRDKKSGDRILPARYSENYLWLLPGETRPITVSWPGSRSPQVVLEGFNVATIKS
jgi:hypothetical protein